MQPPNALNAESSYHARMDPIPHDNHSSTQALGRLRRLATWFYLGLSLIALIWMRLHTGTWLPPSLFGGHVFISLLMGTALGLVTVWVSYFLSTHISSMRTLAWEMHRMLGPVNRKAAFQLAILSAIGEELFFRGAMQPTFGYIATSLIFGLVHIGPNRRFRAWTLSAIVMGFMLGGIVVYTGNLLGAIIAHFLINFINLQWIGAMQPDEGDTSTTPATETDGPDRMMQEAE